MLVCEGDVIVRFGCRELPKWVGLYVCRNIYITYLSVDAYDSMYEGDRRNYCASATVA